MLTSSSNTPQTPRRIHALRVLHDVRVHHCCACASWDRAMGQAAIANHPTFALATRVLSPSAMSRRAVLDANGVLLRHEDNGLEPTTQWSDLGACLHHLEGRFAHDSCPSFRRPVLRELLERMLGGQEHAL